MCRKSFPGNGWFSGPIGGDLHRLYLVDLQPMVVLLFPDWAASYPVVSLLAIVTLRIMERSDLSCILDVLFLRYASDSWPGFFEFSECFRAKRVARPFEK